MASTGDRTYLAQLTRVDELGVYCHVRPLGGPGEFGPLGSLVPLDVLRTAPAGSTLLVTTVGGLQDHLVVVGRVVNPGATGPA